MDISLSTAVATFFGIFLLVLVPYYLLVVSPERREQRKLRGRMKGGRKTAQVTTEAGGSVVTEETAPSGFHPLDAVMAGPLGRHLDTLVAQAGLKVEPVFILAGIAGLTVLGLIGGLVATRLAWLALLAAVLLGSSPYLVVYIIRSRRFGKFEEQFPDAVDLIGRALRAGHAFGTGLSMASEEAPEPVASEFRRLHEQQTYGLPLNDALRSLAIRVPLMDVRFFVTAVLTQRESGGNLAEVLDNLTKVVRERFKVKRQLQVLSTRGRLTGAILAALPPGLGVFMLIRNPENLNILLTEPMGRQMLVAALLLQLLGAYLIKKITTIEY